MKKQYFITTPIYYPNDKLHLGHLYTTTLADVFKRFQILMGNECFFLTGSDEHGEKILQAALKNKSNPQDYVNKIILEFKKLWKEFDIDYSRFVRTTNKYHKETVTKIILKLLNKEFIYKSKYKSKYCVSCETYFTKYQIKNSELCPLCEKKLATIDEPAYFLTIKNEKNWIENYWNKNLNFIYPKKIITELTNNFLENKFHDLCITRKNLPWGIQFPKDDKYTIYVWFDALINYLSATGYENEQFSEYKKIWLNDDCEIIHLMSKEITRFHCIYWPILLKFLNIRQPNRIIVHGWLLMNNSKMSKSKGQVINPLEFKKKYNSDAIRYYLIRATSLENDHVFTENNFIKLINDELANNFGNLFNRVNVMIQKYYNFNFLVNKQTLKNDKFKNICINKFKQYSNFMEQLQYSKALNYFMDLINLLNKSIENNKPWELFKNKKIILLNEFFLELLFGLRIISYMVKPVLINACNEIDKSYNFNYDDLYSENNILKGKLSKITILFKRINDV